MPKRRTVQFKAWDARPLIDILSPRHWHFPVPRNSRAIAKFHNMGIGHFGHNAFIHELIRGSLINAVDSWCKRIVLAKPQSTQVEKPKNENWEVFWQYQERNFNFAGGTLKISSLTLCVFCVYARVSIPGLPSAAGFISVVSN